MQKLLFAAALALAAWVWLNPGHQPSRASGGGSLFAQFGMPAAGVGGAAIGLAGRVAP